MKKLLPIILCLIILLSLVGCSTETTVVSVNVENNSSLNGMIFGKSALIEIGNDLWYDSTTRIVYWWNGDLRNVLHSPATTPSPYYAPNGLPYLYNPETNTFEEINHDS